MIKANYIVNIVYLSKIFKEILDNFCYLSMSSSYIIYSD